MAYYTLKYSDGSTPSTALIKRVCSTRGYKYLTEGMFFVDSEFPASLSNKNLEFTILPLKCDLTCPPKFAVLQRLLEMLKQRAFTLAMVSGDIAYVQTDNGFYAVDLLRQNVFDAPTFEDAFFFINFCTSQYNIGTLEANVYDLAQDPEFKNIVPFKLGNETFVFFKQDDSLYCKFLLREQKVEMQTYLPEKDEWVNIAMETTYKSTEDALVVLDYSLDALL